MALELFNPFSRYVVVKLQRRYFESEYGYNDSVDLVMPLCFCEELEEAERIVCVMDDGRYEVRENAAWKALDKQAGYFRSQSLETQAATAMEALSDLHVTPYYRKDPEGADPSSAVKFCINCRILEAEQGSASCESCAAQLKQKLSEKAEADYRERSRERLGASLLREELPDTPTATPTGHGVWTKS